MKKSIFVSTLVAATALAAPAFADTWTATGDSGEWATGTNWESGTWTDGSDATFGSGYAPEVTVSSGTVTAGTVTIGDAYTFNISGTLTTGQITISGGSLALTGSGKLAATTGSSNGDALVVDASSFTGTLEVNGWLDGANSTLTNSDTTIVLDTTGGSSELYSDATSITYANSGATQENPKSYEFAANLVLSGEGGVLLRTSNSNVTVNITGDVTGSSAELQINGGGNANFTGTVNLGTYITYQGSTTFAGETTIGTLEFSNDGGGTNASSVTFSTDASVGAITVDTTRASAFTDQLTVDSGATLTVGSISLGADSLEVTASEGTMIVTGDITVDGGKLVIGEGSTLTATGATADGVATLQGIAGAGTLSIEGDTENTVFTVTTDDGFAGTVDVQKGFLRANGSSIASGATLTLQASGEASGGYYNNADVSLQFSDDGTFASDITVGGESGGVIFRSGTFAGEIAGTVTSEAADIQKNGTGSLTYTGEVNIGGSYINYQGTSMFMNGTTIETLDIFVNQGNESNVVFSGDNAVADVTTLAIETSAGGTASLTVEAGASLTVGTLAVSHNLAITIDNATLSITTSATQSSSDISTSIVISNGGQLNVESGVSLNVDAMEIILSTDNIDADTAILTGSGAIAATAVAITVDGALATLLSESAEGTTYTFNLYDTSLNLAGTDFILSAFNEYGYAIIDYNTGNLIVVVDIPEPSMFGLMFGLGAIGLVATRRRRRA